MSKLKNRRSQLLAGLVAVTTAAGLIGGLLGTAGHASAGVQSESPPGAATGLGQRTGLLPTDHLVLESALQVDLSKETVRLPLYPGKGPNGQKRPTPDLRLCI